MSVICSADDVKILGTIMSIWAHPDDETFTCGGIMAAAVRNGQKVICVTATKGEAGVQDATKWSPENLGAIREQELKAALAILGIEHHYWLDYRDGCCNEANKEVAAKELAALIDEHKPQTILTFGKDGMTGHSDHCCVSCWVDDAVAAAQVKPRIYHAAHTNKQSYYLKTLDEKLNFFFNVEEPVFCDEKDCAVNFVLDAELNSKKLAALKIMPSQTSNMFEQFDEQFLSEALGVEAFIEAK